jgi:hypothetical protein
MNDTRPLPRLSDYGRHVRRYWRRLVGLSLIGAIAGGAIFFSISERYYATSRVALSPQITYLSLSPIPEKQPLVTLDTTAQLVRSDFAIDRIAEAMGVSDEEARDSLVISAKPLSRVLIVQIRADTKDQARAGAHAATEVLIQLQAETFALGNKRVRELKNRVTVLESQAQESLAEGLPSNSLFESVRILEQKLDRAIATNNTSSQVIMRATVVSYRPGEAEVFIVSGLTIGLALALISAGPARPGAPARRRTRRFVKVA